jgi:predicted RNA binding protein YcfA (HicA-like mRNA interferase family)
MVLEAGMKFREVEKIIKQDGWQYLTTDGSHYQYRHATKPGKVTIPYHSGELDIKTVKSIMRQAGIAWRPK